MPATDTADHDPTGRPRRRRWLPLALLCLLLAWAVTVGVLLIRAQSAARAGLDDMESVRSSSTGDITTFINSIGGPVDDTPEEEVAATLDSANANFTEVGDAVDSPVVAPLKALPVVGRQLRSVSALAGAASATTAAAADAYAVLEQEWQREMETPAERLESVSRIAAALNELSDRIGNPDLGPARGLVGPLADARSRFDTEHGQMMSTLTDATLASDAVRAFLEGPTRYLLLAANNGEMRNGSGMFLQAGPMTVEAGGFDIVAMSPTRDLTLDAPGTTPDPDVETMWGWLAPDQEFRNVNVTPRFDESARMVADMWAAAGRVPVDGVAAIDVVGIERLLEIVGPVEVPDPAGGPNLTFSSANIGQELLVEQYRDFGNRYLRDDLLGSVTAAVFDAFNTRSFSASDLVRTLEELGRGRHLLLWSSDEVQQRGWEALGSSGTLPNDALMLSVINRNGTKLDQFLDVRAELAAVTEGDLRHMEVTVSIDNRTPDGLPRYIAGPYPGTDYAPGEYAGIAVLTVPEGAGNLAVDGGELALSGEDGPTGLIGSPIRVGAGETVTRTFTFDLPTSWNEVTVLPSARVPPVSWSAAGGDWSDETPVDLALDATN